MIDFEDILHSHSIMTMRLCMRVFNIGFNHLGKYKAVKDSNTTHKERKLVLYNDFLKRKFTHPRQV